MSWECDVLLAYRFRRLISCWLHAAENWFVSNRAASQCRMYGLIGFRNGALKKNPYKNKIYRPC